MAAVQLNEATPRQIATDTIKNKTSSEVVDKLNGFFQIFSRENNQLSDNPKAFFNLYYERVVSQEKLEQLNTADARTQNIMQQMQGECIQAVKKNQASNFLMGMMGLFSTADKFLGVLKVTSFESVKNMIVQLDAEVPGAVDDMVEAVPQANPPVPAQAQ
jgi:hypothetical protein